MTEHRKIWLPALSVAALAVLAGCATATIDDAVPRSLSDADPVSSQAAADGAGSSVPPALDSSGAARVTGSFPDLNVPPRAAAPQLTEAEAAARRAELLSRRQGIRQDGSIAASSAASATNLRQLGATHGAEALRAIEEE